MQLNHPKAEEIMEEVNENPGTQWQQGYFNAVKEVDNDGTKWNECNIVKLPKVTQEFLERTDVKSMHLQPHRKKSDFAKQMRVVYQGKLFGADADGNIFRASDEDMMKFLHDNDRIPKDWTIDMYIFALHYFLGELPRLTEEAKQEKAMKISKKRSAGRRECLVRLVI